MIKLSKLKKMNKIYLFLLLMQLAIPVFAAPAINDIQTNENEYNEGKIPRYKKFEVLFQVSTSAQNFQLPFDSNPPAGVDGNEGVTVNAVFSNDNWQTSAAQPAFYFQGYEHEIKGGGDWIYPSGNNCWKVRFAPRKTGAWQFKLTVRDSEGYFETVPQNFEVVSSASKGFVKVSDTDCRYFQYDNGELFRGNGHHLGYKEIDWDNPTVGNEARFQDLNAKGIEFCRTWLSSWGIFGSSWAPWSTTDPGASAYIPESQLTTNYAQAGRDYSMYLNSGKPGMYLGFGKKSPAVKRNTDYHVSVKYFIPETLTGPRIGGNPYGFCVKLLNQFPGDVEFEDPGIGTLVTAHAFEATGGSWLTLEGNFNSGNSDYLPNFMLVAENISNGSVYIDDIVVREEQGGGNFGPNIISKGRMDYHKYMDQLRSYAFDKSLELLEKYNIHLKIVMLEKLDYTLSHIDHNGLAHPGYKMYEPVPGQGLEKDEDHSWFYGNYRNMTKTRWLQQAYMRYAQARWGYSTSIHSWEILNEGSPTSEPHAFMIDEMAKYLKQYPLNYHLLTTSTWHSFPKNLFWQNPELPDIDYADFHHYSYFTSDIASDSNYYGQLYGAKTEEGAGIPLVRGETGYPSTDLTLDSQGTWFHNYIWVGLNSSGVYEQFFDAAYQIHERYEPFDWPEELPYDTDISYHYIPYDNFTCDLKLNNGIYIDAEAIPSSEEIRVYGQKDMFGKRAHLWIQNAASIYDNVKEGGTARPVTEASLTVPGLIPNQSYTVEWWDTYQQNPELQVISSETLVADAAGNLFVTVCDPDAPGKESPLANDIAVKIYFGNENQYAFLPGGIDTSGTLSHEVQVSSTGKYHLNALVSSTQAGTKFFHIELNGSDITGPMEFDDASGDGVNVFVDDIFLPGGFHNLTLVKDGGEFNVSGISAWLSETLNKKPNVDAGEDIILQTRSELEYPVSFSLSPQITDDSLPAGFAMQYRWLQLNGPIINENEIFVNFANPDAKETEVSFSEPGDYTLRIIAYDGELASFDDITISIQAIEENLLQNPGFEEGEYPWLALDGTAGEIDFSSSHTELASLKLIHSGATRTYFQNAQAVPGKNYKFSGWIKLNSPTSANFDDLKMLDMGENPVNISPTLNAGSDKSVNLNSAASLSNLLPANYETDNSRLHGNEAHAEITLEWVADDYSIISSVNAGSISGNNQDWTEIAKFASAPENASRVRFKLSMDAAGALCQYLDSDIKITDMPSSLANAVFIRTAIADTANFTTDFISFDSNCDIAVFVALDDSTSGKPSWVDGTWTDSGMKILNSDGVVFSLYRKDFSAGTITLGGNEDLGSMYSVLVIKSSELPEFNTAPGVDAGADIEMQLPALAVLDGTVIDDGNPAGSVLSTEWSLVSGPGEVVFTNISEVDTTAEFSLAGDYILRLSADDGEYVRDNTLLVRVKPEKTINVQNVVLSSESSYIFDPGGIVDGKFIYSDTWEYRYRNVPLLVRGLPYIRLASADKAVTGPEYLTFYVDQDVTIYIAHSKSETQKPAWMSEFTFTGETINEGTSVGAEIYARDFQKGFITLGGNIPEGGDGVYMYSVIIKGKGTPEVINLPPDVNVSKDGTTSVFYDFEISALVFDDDMPEPVSLTTQWSKVSGPGTANFADPAAVNTTVSFDLPGSYVIQLTANDGDLSTSDSLTVEVDEGLITNVSASTGNPHSKYVISEGETLYSDSAETVTFLPELFGKKEFIRTASADAAETGADYLAFELSANAVVYAAYDADAANLPAWLDDGSWEATAFTIAADDGVSRKLYSKRFAAGLVTLGGNQVAPADPGTVNYTVIALPDDLEGHWKMDETTGLIAYDSSVYHHDGTLSGGTIRDTGVLDESLNFDGIDGYVDTGYNKDLEQWTIMCWVKSPEAAKRKDGHNSGPIRRGQNFAINWHHRGAGAVGAVSIKTANGWHNAHFGQLDGEIWYHLTATYDGDVLKAYRDGVLIEENDEPDGPTAPETETLKFGRHSGADLFFEGNVDDIRIYNRPLTDSEIAKFAPNNAPVISVAADRYSVPLGSNINLTATVEDDGLPVWPHEVSYKWQAFETGSGEIIFGNTANLNTNASFTEPGLYTIRFVANDGSAYSFKDIDIAVSEVPDLLGHWKLDDAEGMTAIDSSVLQNNGSLRGNTTWIEGVAGGALELNGVGSDVNSDFLLNIPAWTISCWVKGDSAPTDGVNDGPIYRRANFQINWDHRSSDFRGAAGLSVDGTWYPASFGELQGGIWYHLSATYDGEVLRAYKNGVLITENTDPSGSPDPEIAPLIIGNGAFNGAIDDVRIYQRELTLEEIGELSINQAPSALSQSLETTEDQALENIVLDFNDPDDGPEPYFIDIIAPPQHGSLLGPVSNLTYAPDTGFNGQDYFDFVVTDGDFAVSQPARISITVNPIPNQAPIVDASPNQEITLPVNIVNLDATVTDDGKPGGNLTTAWSIVSGPGGVSFGNSSAVDTTAQFSEAGTFVLRLTASDGELESQDEVTITVNQQPIPENSLIAHWQLDETEGTIAVDETGNGYEGILNGGTFWTEKGKIDGCVELDGSDGYVDTGFMENLATWTIACWVKSDHVPDNSGNNGPMNRGANFQINWDHKSSVFRGAAGLQVNGTWYPASFGTLNANTWYHLAATYDGETLRAYKNGVLITENSDPSGAPNAETQSMALGNLNENPDFNFAGFIDDARLYNYALSEEDIANLANPEGN